MKRTIVYVFCAFSVAQLHASKVKSFDEFLALKAKKGITVKEEVKLGSHDIITVTGPQAFDGERLILTFPSDNKAHLHITSQGVLFLKNITLNNVSKQSIQIDDGGTLALSRDVIVIAHKQNVDTQIIKIATRRPATALHVSHHVVREKMKEDAAQVIDVPAVETVPRPAVTDPSLLTRPAVPRPSYEVRNKERASKPTPRVQRPHHAHSRRNSQRKN